MKGYGYGATAKGLGDAYGSANDITFVYVLMF